MNRDSLHPFQKRAINFILKNKKAAIWLFLGAGKSVIALTAASEMLSQGFVKRVLVVAPLRVARSVWKQEALKWEHLNHLQVSIVTGTAKERKAALNTPGDVWVMNVENVRWLVDLCAEKRHWPFDCIILDEASLFKSHATHRFRALRKVIPHTKAFIELTGSPAPNSLMDVFSQIYLLDQGKSLGRTITGYRERFFTSDYFGYTWTIKDGAAEKIRELIKPMVLSMEESKYVALPDRMDLTERIELPTKIKKQYDDFERELFLDLGDEEVTAMSAAVLANKLLQMSSGAVYVNDEHDWKTIHSCKLDTLKEIIEENSSESILIAYGYRHTLERIMDRFPDAVALDKNPETIARWNRKEIKLLVVHPASASYGLNLQGGGSLLVWVDLPWSLLGYSQLNARLHRQGQARPVRIVHLIIPGTIDETVMGVLKHKDTEQKDLLRALRERGLTR